jgi:glucose/arabinose dehydrogenase
MLYIAVPSSCDFCESENPLSGTIIRMQLDGSEPEIIARGLRYPAALEIYHDALWVTDSAHDGFDINTYYDEINRIDLNSDDVPHFGFPYCFGAENTPDLASDFDCSTATAPVINLPTRSNPIALQHYTSDTFPNISDSLMVVLLGSNNSSHITGHAIFAYQPTDEGNMFELITPVDDTTAGRGTGFPSRWHRVDGLLFHSEFVNNQGGGIFPHFPYDIAVSPEGWLYFSVNGKGIYVLRPQT